MPEGDDSAEELQDPEEDLSPENRSGAHNAWKRATICVSSQIGCAVNCQFCLTAKLGLQRNLTAGEIAGQVVAVLDRHQVELNKARVNLVFMGMGEPFLNYDSFMVAVRLLIEEVGIAAPRMTVSTSGIVPGILRFAQEKVRPKLAISLNAPNDEVRESNHADQPQMEYRHPARRRSADSISASRTESPLSTSCWAASLINRGMPLRSSSSYIDPICLPW